MNKWGALAQKAVRDFDPGRYQQITALGETSYFTTLGVRIETRIQALTDELIEAQSPDPEYLTEVGRRNMCRLQAEERILYELVYSELPTATLENHQDPIDELEARQFRQHMMETFSMTELEAEQYVLEQRQRSGE